MNIELITELPAWWIFICLIAGLAYAILLYRRDRSLESVNKWLRRSLFTLRTLVVFILSVLLLTPLIKSMIREKEKPLVIIAQDNSESIVLNKDSVYYRTEYKEALEKLSEKLKDKFDVRTLNWGDRIYDRIDYSYTDKQTDFSSMQKQLSIRYGNRNIGAIVIASDGLYNRGSSPLYDNNLKAPVYTIALGDTTVQKDVLISRVNYNKRVYFGNTFPLEISVNARQCNNEKTVLTVSRDTTILFSREIAIGGNRYSQLVNVLLEAKKTGLVRYRIRLSSVEGEMTLINNTQDIYVEVVESRQKILIVANAPHPDLGVLKEGIESSANYTANIHIDGEPVQVSEYNMVIMHNLPSARRPATEILEQIKKTATPVWYIIGSQTSLALFNNLQAGLSIISGADESNNVQAIISPDFSRFTLSDDFRRMIPLFPPLLTPFGQFNLTTENSILLRQQIGSVSTDEPLQLFNESNSTRNGILCGEGLWRWRLNDYYMNGNFNVFQEWLLKTIQNLNVKDNNSRFRLINKNHFAENEPITFDAEVYNDNYELINTSDVSINIVNSQKKSFPYTFSKTERSYTLNAGYFPEGQYTFKATVNVGGKIYQSAGEFSVAALKAEQLETVADHRLLNTLSQQTGGEMFYPTDLEVLANKLIDRTDIKTISYSHYKLRDLVDWKLIFFLLLGLLTAEWLIRKRSGAY